MNIVTPKEIADLLKVSETTVYNLARAGKLGGFRVGSSWRFDMDDVILKIIKDEKDGTKRYKV